MITRSLFTGVAVLAIFTATGQPADKVTGSYVTIDSSGFEENGKRHTDIDSTLLVLDSNMTFSYKWAPMFVHSDRHLVTTGTWQRKGDKVLLTSKYQQDEYRFFESYRPEYGDSLVKIYVQTYDSLIGFLQLQFIGVIRDTAKDSQMIFRDKDYPYNACSATFHFPSVDKIYFYGDIGRMPAILPRNKKSNHFLLQYNLSVNWDYQYFKDFEVTIQNGQAILGSEKDHQVTLTKL